MKGKAGIPGSEKGQTSYVGTASSTTGRIHATTPTRPEPKLTRAQEVEVKATARTLLARLQELVAVRDWRGRQQPRAEVYSAIRVELDNLPQEPFPSGIWDMKVEAIWQHVFDRYGATGASRH